MVIFLEFSSQTQTHIYTQHDLGHVEVTEVIFSKNVSTEKYGTRAQD